MAHKSVYNSLQMHFWAQNMPHGQTNTELQ